MEHEQALRQADAIEEKRIKDEVRTNFNQTLIEAHKFYKAGKFVLAIRCYDVAIEIFEAITTQFEKELLLSDDEVSVILYARGLSSVNQMIPVEVNLSVKFFEKMIKNHPRFHRISTAHFGLGFANYFMNNFDAARKHLKKSLSLLKTFSSNVILTWPGTDCEMIECSYEYLRQQLTILQKNCVYPPRPHARCLSEHCAKYYPRTQIYITDLHFDGYMIARCTFNCILCFHRKCWGWLKSDLGIGPDDLLINEPCWTSDCKGIIEAIITVDEYGIQHIKHQLKKLIKQERQGQLKIKYRMSKSKHNMEKVLLRLNERKASQRQKQEHDRRLKEQKIMEKLKEMTDKISQKDAELTEDKRNSGIPYKKKQALEHETLMNKTNKHKKKGKPHGITLRELLTEVPGYHSNMRLEDIQKSIDEIKSMNEPFEISEKLFHEITEFESTIGWHPSETYLTTDLQKVIALHMLRYFEDFFCHHGPMKCEDVLFQHQQEVLTMDMQEVVYQRYDSIAYFLTSSNMFTYNNPYLGTLDQSDVIEKLCHNYFLTHKRRDSEEVLSNSQTHEKDNSNLSAFAKEFYSLGNVTNADKFIPDEEDDYKEILRFETKPMDHDEFDTVVGNMGDPSRDNGYEDDQLYLPNLYDDESNIDKILDGTDSTHSIESSIKQASTETSSVASECVKTGRTPDVKYINVSTITEDVSVRPKYKTKAKQCQTNPNNRSIHTQTKGRDELVKSREAIKRLQDRTSELEDDLTKSKRIYTMKEKKMQKEVEDVKAENIKFLAMVNEKKNVTVKDSSDKVVNENKQLKDKMLKLDETNKQHESEMYNLKADLVKMEQLYADARTKHLANKFELEETNQMLINKLMLVNDRVKKSELVTLETQQKVALMNLHKAKMECQQISHEFDNKLKIFASRNADSAVITLINDARGKWTANIDECTKRIAMVQSQFAKQKEQINHGKPLEDLPPVPIPAPPPGGLTPRQLETIITNKMQTIAANMNGFSGQIMRPQTSGSPVIQSKLPATKAAIKPPSTSALAGNSGSIFNGGNSLTQQQQSVASEKLNRLIVMIQQEFPILSRNTILAYITKVRTANNNTLSGLEYREILRRVKEIADRESNHFAWDLPSSSSSPAFPSAHDEPESCVICYDPLTDKVVKTLACKHIFHAECINQWLEKQKTCPNCRQATQHEKSKAGMKVSGVFPSFVFPPGLLDAGTQ